MKQRRGMDTGHADQRSRKVGDKRSYWFAAKSLKCRPFYFSSIGKLVFLQEAEDKPVQFLESNIRKNPDGPSALRQLRADHCH